MKVTVCELNDESDDFERDWERLVAHVRTNASDLVLLPEMPFIPWFGVTREFDSAVWHEAVAAHETGLTRLAQLAPAVVISSRPVNVEGQRLNEGFVWHQCDGYRAAHHKYYLPDEEGFWEASWYSRGAGDFSLVQIGDVRLGFAICTELWFMDRARTYGQQGVHLLVTPRATPRNSNEKWLTGGRVSAIISGAFSLSSNHVSGEDATVSFGGQGWVIDPNGDVLGLTSRERPLVTVEIDVTQAEQAKRTYPRYVPD